MIELPINIHLLFTQIVFVVSLVGFATLIVIIVKEKE